MSEDQTYFKNISASKFEAIKLVHDHLKKVGIVQDLALAAILAVVSKESDFTMRSETSYRNTNVKRIRTIFASKVKHLNDAQIEALKGKDEAFFNLIYGSRYGNAPDEGYKYRGRGFNQLTFKSNYITYSKIIGVDLVANPDRLNTMPVAAAVLAAFFDRQFKNAPQAHRTAYGFTTANDFHTLEDATNAAYNANAGWGKSPATIRASKKVGYQRAHARAPGFLVWVHDRLQAAANDSNADGLS
jgi:predicted chitinase